MAFFGKIQLKANTIAGQIKDLVFGNDGSIPVSIKQATAFNEVNTAENTPEIQTTFPYGVQNTRLIETHGTTGSGAVQFNGSSDRAMTLTSGGTASSFVSTQTVKTVKYRSGQGVYCKFAMIVPSWTANAGNGYYHGLGLLQSNLIRDGFLFARSGTGEFSVVHFRNSSIVSTVEQSSWNIDVMDGSNGASNPSGQNLDVSKLNVFKIEYQYLGGGAILFSIEDKETGEFHPVHRIKYANTNTETSMINPSVKFISYVLNGLAGDTITTRITSIEVGIQGKVKQLGLTNSAEVVNKNSTLLNGHLLTIRGRGTYGGELNLIRAFLTQISAHNESTSFDRVSIIQNATLTGTSFTDIDTNNSSIEVDTSGTYTLGTGDVLTSYPLPKSGTAGINQIIKELEYLTDKDTSISLITDGNSNNVSATLTFSEDF